MSSCELGAKSMALSYLSDLKTCGTSMGFCRVAKVGDVYLDTQDQRKVDSNILYRYQPKTSMKHPVWARPDSIRFPFFFIFCLPCFACGFFLWSDDPCDVTTYLQKRARQWPSAHTVLSYVYTESNTCFRRWDAGCWKSWSVALRPHAELRRDGHLGSPIETASFHFWVHQCLKRSWSQFWTTNQVEKPWFQPWFRESDLPSGKLTWLIMENLYFQ